MNANELADYLENQDVFPHQKETIDMLYQQQKEIETLRDNITQMVIARMEQM